MAYTALFVEVLIVGIQTSTWIIFLLLKFAFKVQPTSAVLWTTLNSASAVTLFVPWVYTIGIVFDRLADELFWRVAAPHVLRRKHISEKHFKDACVLVIEKSGVASVDYYRYYLSRVRIIRSAVINTPLALMSAYLVYPLNWKMYLPFSLVVTFVAVWSYLTLIERYIERTMRIHSLLQTRLHPATPTPGVPITPSLTV